MNNGNSAPLALSISEMGHFRPIRRVLPDGSMSALPQTRKSPQRDF